MGINLISEPTNGEQVTENASLLYTREWIEKAKEEGHFNYIPMRRISAEFSAGQLIAMKYLLEELKNKKAKDHKDYVGYCKIL